MIADYGEEELELLLKDVIVEESEHGEAERKLSHQQTKRALELEVPILLFNED